MNEEKLKEYFLEEEIFTGFNDFTGYRVLGTFQFSSKYNTITSSGVAKIFKTDSVAWVEEFRIGVIQNMGDYLVMVSSECPEVYFTMPEEIIEKIKDIYYSEEYYMPNNEELQKLIKEMNDKMWIDGITTNPLLVRDSRIWYDSSTSSPLTPYSSTITSTCSSADEVSITTATFNYPDYANTCTTRYNI